MAAVDPGYALWLKAKALFVESTNATVDGAWGTRATISERVSPLATKAAADTEAARQRALLEAPMVIDRLSVPGLRSDLIGQPVTLTADRLGYAGGVVCFVIGVVEMEKVERTMLTVLRRM